MREYGLCNDNLDKAIEIAMRVQNPNASEIVLAVLIRNEKKRLTMFNAANTASKSKSSSVGRPDDVGTDRGAPNGN